MSYSIYGGGWLGIVLDVDGVKMYCTPDGGKFFSTDEQFMDYVKEKCGKDVTDCFIPARDFMSEHKTYYGSLDIEELRRALDECDKEYKNPVSELKSLRKLKEDYEKVLNALEDIYYTFDL